MVSCPDNDHPRLVDPSGFTCMLERCDITWLDRCPTWHQRGAMVQWYNFWSTKLQCTTYHGYFYYFCTVSSWTGIFWIYLNGTLSGRCVRCKAWNVPFHDGMNSGHPNNPDCTRSLWSKNHPEIAQDGCQRKNNYEPSANMQSKSYIDHWTIPWLKNRRTTETVSPNPRP